MNLLFALVHLVLHPIVWVPLDAPTLVQISHKRGRVDLVRFGFIE